MYGYFGNYQLTQQPPFPHQNVWQYWSLEDKMSYPNLDLEHIIEDIHNYIVANSIEKFVDELINNKLFPLERKEGAVTFLEKLYQITDEKKYFNEWSEFLIEDLSKYNILPIMYSMILQKTIPTPGVIRLASEEGKKQIKPKTDYKWLWFAGGGALLLLIIIIIATKNKRIR